MNRSTGGTRRARGGETASADPSSDPPELIDVAVSRRGDPSAEPQDRSAERATEILVNVHAGESARGAERDEEPSRRLGVASRAPRPSGSRPQYEPTSADQDLILLHPGHGAV